MERLTKRITQYTVELSASANPIQYNGSSQRVHIKHPFWNVFDRLCKYEDAEENGMLIHLPCRVGDTLYQPINEHINEYKVIGLCFDILQNKWIFEVAYEVVGVWNKTTCDFDVIGKTVFLTREEAEQALKQMGE